MRQPGLNFDLVPLKSLFHKILGLHFYYSNSPEQCTFDKQLVPYFVILFSLYPLSISLSLPSPYLFPSPYLSPLSLSPHLCIALSFPSPHLPNSLPSLYLPISPLSLSPYFPIFLSPPLSISLSFPSPHLPISPLSGNYLLLILSRSLCDIFSLLHNWRNILYLQSTVLEDREHFKETLQRIQIICVMWPF